MKINFIKLKEKLKTNCMHLICLGFMALFLVCGIIYFPNCLCRLYEAVRDLVLSFGYYFTELFGEEGTVKVTVNDFPALQWAPSKFQPLTLFPISLEEFLAKCKNFAVKLFSWQNFGEYLLFIVRLFLDLYKFLLPLTCLFILLYYKAKTFYKRENNDYNEDSRSVAIFRKIWKNALLPFGRFCKALYEFAAEKKYLKISLYLWALYFNLYVIVIEFSAYYFYFIPSFDILNLYRQVYKLLLDLTPMIRFVPLPVWLVIGVAVWNKAAISRGKSKLYHNERKNRGFVKARQLFVYIVGLMGAGKTTQAVDMALSDSVQMRDDALEIIFENDLRFPNFPWINFELSLREVFESGRIKNVRDCKVFVYKLRRRFEEDPRREYLFDYDFEAYSTRYYNGLKYVSIWESLEEYACAYYIYVIDTSLIQATISVREDSFMMDKGNFPIWNHDFFNRHPKYKSLYSKYAHIFDQDMVRLGKRMVKNNPKRFAFGFGVYFWDELDKERKNSVELQELKKSDETINQKNDLFEPFIKVIRHGCMIGRRNFVKCYGTGQRIDDLGAKLRGVCEVINVAKVAETELALPFWAPYYVFMDIFGRLIDKFEGLYTEYRFNRSDNVLPMQGYHYLVSKIVQVKEVTTNTFGYSTVTLEVESGKLEAKFKKHTWYRAYYKVYNDRFVSDALGGWFNRRLKKSGVGLLDIPCYKSERATAEELDQANLLFIKEFNEYDK